MSEIIPGEIVLNSYTIFSQSMNDLVNGWFRKWWSRKIADSDWEQVADELDAVYTKHPYILIREIGVSLVRELERRNFGK